MPNNLEPYHERGFRFACEIVRLYLQLIQLPGVPPHLARQVLKSGTSIGANLEEAEGAPTRPDKANKFSVALKEARETLYWLRLLLATHLVDPKLVELPIAEAKQLVAILTVTRRKLNPPRLLGSK
jgi:four helix bundle protein